MSWDSTWEKIFQTRPWGKYPGEDLIRFVARNFYGVSDRNGVRILEVGCGIGANLWYLAREGFQAYGIDGSETAISRARERLDKECAGWQGELQVGDIVDLPYPDEFFDGVIDIGGICCNSFEASRRIYKEMARVSKRGGKMFSRVFATGCAGDGQGQKVGHNAWIPANGPLAGIGYLRFTALDEIPQLIEGFEVTAVELLAFTVGNREHEIRSWCIHGQKPA